MPTVFRWNIARREQLGRLVDGGPAEVHPLMMDELRVCCARVIAMAGDARLVFIGRSPEYLFDYLTGAFADTSWANRLAIVNLSLKQIGARSDELAPETHIALRDQLAAHRLTPRDIASGAHPVALVDLIYGGETFGKLTECLIAWATETGVGWRAVRRRIRIVGITERQHKGLRIWRWRTLEWAAAYRPSALKGVSVPYWFWTHLGDSDKKVSRPNPPERWYDPEMERPPRGADFNEALRIALALHDLGRSRTERAAMAAELTQQPAMREGWCRVLAAEIRSGGAARRIERNFSSKYRMRSWRGCASRR